MESGIDAEKLIDDVVTDLEENCPKEWFETNWLKPIGVYNQCPVENMVGGCDGIEQSKAYVLNYLRRYDGMTFCDISTHFEENDKMLQNVLLRLLAEDKIVFGEEDSLFFVVELSDVNDWNYYLNNAFGLEGDEREDFTQYRQ